MSQVDSRNSHDRGRLLVDADEALPSEPVRVLSEADAVDLWLARWLKTPRKIIRSRYACDPRRIYEVWEGTRFPSSRAKALERLRLMYPSLAGGIDVSRHRRIARGGHPGQLSLFEAHPAGHEQRSPTPPRPLGTREASKDHK